MTSVELKEQVISKIHITEDKDVLEFVLEFLHQSDITEPYTFSDEQNKRLNISLEESKKGLIISEDEERKMTEEWFGK